MLVLSRRVGESVVIGDGIVVTVLEVRGDVVRVGVDAPRSVQVTRQELLVELEATNKAAASPQPDAVSGLSRLVRGDREQPEATEDAAPTQPGSESDPASKSPRPGPPAGQPRAPQEDPGGPGA